MSTSPNRRGPPAPLVAACALAAVALGGCGGGTAGARRDHTPPAREAAARSTAIATALPAAARRHHGVSWVAGREPVSAQDFAPLVGANVRWIAQTPFGWQRDERSTEVRLVTSGRVHWGETDEGLEATVRLARQHGVETLLKPHVWLTRPGEGAWRAEIGMASDTDWERWFASYRRFALHYAALAERLQIPVYCIGTELHRTVRERPDDWRRLIAEVREVYSGQLTYAANWYREVDDVPFWDALDLIGVQAYFPLSSAPVPTVAELEAGWRPHAAALAALAARHRRPILFTEVGYVSRPGATAEPWRWPETLAGEAPVAAGLEVQARAYEAFFRTFWDRPWVAGAYIWKWYPRGGPDHSARVDFSPQGKPAEGVLRRWYGKRR